MRKVPPFMCYVGNGPVPPVSRFTARRETPPFRKLVVSTAVGKTSRKIPSARHPVLDQDARRIP